MNKNYMKFVKKTKSILIYFLIIIFAIFILELISRISIYTITKKKEIFKFGFKKNVEFAVSSFSNLDFIIIDHLPLDRGEKIKKNNNNEIWVFGGSTSAIACKKTNNTSWPNELNNIITNFKIINFAKSGKSSDFSLKKLESEFMKSVPEKIIWAHFINEVDIIYFNKNNKPNHQNKLLYFFHSLSLTFEKNLISYNLFNDFIKRLLWQLDIGINKEEKQYSKSDYKFASENYYKNTARAINLSKSLGVKEFIIIILPTKNSFDDKENSFLEYFLVPKIQKIEKKYSAIIINLDKLIRSNNIKYDDYFCSPDRIHFTFGGNKFIAKEIYKLLENK